MTATPRTNLRRSDISRYISGRTCRVPAFEPGWRRPCGHEGEAFLMSAGRHDVLLQLQQGLRPSDVARGQKHRVFATSTDLVECFSGKMIEEKLRYIHANPVSKRWMLAEDAVEYPHSSFAFYVRGEQRAAPLAA